MRSISIFNDVLGPVMRGPSSSHTAGSFHIARIVRDLLGFGDAAARHSTVGSAPRPIGARFTFDPRGSYARVFREQGVDRAFATGLLGWDLTDPRFLHALDLAAAESVDLDFDVRMLEGADHPNTVEIAVRTANRTLRVRAQSIGGGSVEIVSLDDWPVHLTGDTWEVLVEVDEQRCARAAELLADDGQLASDVEQSSRGTACLLHARRYAALSEATRAALQRCGATSVREARPISFVKRGQPLVDAAEQMIPLAQSTRRSLGQVALAHEASLLGITEADAVTEMLRRLDVMIEAVTEGLRADGPAMQLLEPSAHRVFEAEAAGRLAMGGPHTRAAARALAAMHSNSRMGVVCAAPTGGSAGVLPAVMVTLLEQSGLAAARTERARAEAGSMDVADKRRAALALFAAGAVGIVVAARATFAAEVAGCQVEIGAAGAMAAAAVVEAAGGSAAQACDAAAIAFQNTMGSVCDLVQGIVEIPCHTRNAVAASSAFVCADLVMGGYRNPIPLDETTDAVLAVGRMLPSELRCTARGGLATTPSALALKPRSR